MAKSVSKTATNADGKVNSAPKNVEPPFIVGIGASAGGLEAIHEFFDYVPEHNDLAFIIVQHLSPDYKSLMAELLTKHTKMLVREAEDGMLIRRNEVYVIPNKKTLIVEKGKLRLTEKISSNTPNTTIDLFFESLGKECKDKAIAIILSGTGSDGSRGIEAVHQNGGLIIVQDPLTAKFDGMPNSAVSTGLVDLILPPELMYEEISLHASHEPSEGGLLDLGSEENLKSVEEIMEMIRNHTSHDFSFYKRPTIHRRIVRRMMLNNFNSLKDFVEFLYSNPHEILLLAKEFLIGVTKFFRDPEAWEVIRKKVIPEIIGRKHYNDSLKLWVAGCSTGEEAYSLAIVIKEELQRVGKDLNVKIFATDIDKDALEVASKGLYSEQIVEDVSLERRDKYFIKEGKNFQVNPHIRKMVIFAHHDLIKDPPFSKIDFISCRNLLIYLNPSLQKKVLGTFHFSMTTGAFLFLGSSESTGDMKTFLSDVDKKWKIYKCIQTSKGIGYESMSLGYNLKNVVTTSVKSNKVSIQNAFSEVLSDTMMEEFNCAGVYIDENYDLVNAIGDFKKYIELPDKRLNLNILKMVPEEVTIPLGTAIRKAFKQNEKSFLRNVRVKGNKETRLINIIVKPIQNENKELPRCILLIFNESTDSAKDKAVDYEHSESNSNQRIKDLESELKETKENLQSAIEELETSNEELQSANEELLSANEELQSTNEELQSLNEELHTVNSEHQVKIKELIELNDDLNNYFRATDIGKVFLDKDLNIRKYTPSVTKQINLIETDIGRPITHISNNIKYSRLVDDIKYSIEYKQPIEKEIQVNDSRWYMMRIVPYLRQDKRIDGAVITFTDVSRLKELYEVITSVLNSSVNGIMALKTLRNSSGIVVDFEWMLINNTIGKWLNKKSDYFIGKRLSDEVPWVKTNGLFDKLVQVVESGQFMREETYLEFDNHKGYYDVSLIKMMDGLTVTLSDITEKKESEKKLKDAYEELRETQENLQELNAELEKHVEARTKELKESQSILKQSNESLLKINNDLDNFIYTASHDLRAPISNIEGLVDALDSVGVNGNEEAVEIINLMRISVNKFKETIKDLTEISRIQKEKLEDIEDLDLQVLFNEIMADIKEDIKTAEAKIKFDIKEATLKFSKRNLRSILYNLLSNAIKYRSPHRIPEIVISSEKVDGYVLIRVKDNGLGIPEKHKGKIFSMFKRFHDHVEGTGVGLYIVKRIIDNENGLIQVDSKEGEGTTFSVYFKRDNH